MTQTNGAGNAALQRIRDGQAMVCMPVRYSRTPNVAYVAHAAGFHALYVDMEHSSIGLDEASRICLAASALGLASLVRVPYHDAHSVVAALEIGATGIIAPHIETADQAAGIVKAARFPPVGERAGAGESVALGYTQLSRAQAAQRLNSETLVIVMIESLKAVQNAKQIAAVEGVDVLFVGTGDLSSELRIDKISGNPRILEIFESVYQACRSQGCCLGVGGIKNDPQMLRQLYVMGARFFSASTDESLLLRAARDELDRLGGILDLGIASVPR